MRPLEEWSAPRTQWSRASDFEPDGPPVGSPKPRGKVAAAGMSLCMMIVGGVSAEKILLLPAFAYDTACAAVPAPKFWHPPCTKIGFCNALV